MTPSAAAMGVIAGALLLFILLAILSRGKAGTVETVVQRGLVVLCLAFAATNLLLRMQPTAASPAKPELFLLVEESFLHADPARVRKEILVASHSSKVRAASFRHTPRRGSLHVPPGAGGGLLRIKPRFSSPEAALGWAELEGAGRGKTRVMVLSRGKVRLQASEGIILENRVIPSVVEEDVILDFSLPDVVFEGRSAKARVLFRAAADRDVSLLLYQGKSLRETRKVAGTAESPKGNVLFELDKVQPGRYVLRLDAVDGSGALLDRAYRSLTVRKLPRTTWFREEGREGPLSDYLQGHGYPVSELSPGRMEEALRGKAGEVIVIENTPPSLLSWSVVSSLYRSVSRDGTGVLVIGGDRSYGPGGYMDAAIERLMPLRMGLKNRDREKHSTAFLVIVDTSTSMRCMPEGCPTDAERMWGPLREARGPRVRKIDLARQALLNLLPAMREMDFFGILGGRVSPYWEVEPGFLGSQDELEERILGIQGGGAGIYLYSSLIEAGKALSEVDAEIKHIVVLVDTADVHERKIFGVGTLDDIVDILEKDDISISFIGIGFSDDEYVPLLNRLASSTGGYLYLTSNVSDVPSFLFQDRKKLARHQVIRKHLLTHFSRKDFPMLESTPSLEGQFITEAKADARTLVWSELGYPVLALRPMGRGAVAALAADSGASLAPAWNSDMALPVWDGIFSRLQAAPSDVERVFFAQRGNTVAAYYAPGRENVFERMESTIEGMYGVTSRLPMLEVFPGIYRRDLGELPAGSYRFALGEEGRDDPRLETVFTVAQDVPAEVPRTPPADSLPRETARATPLHQKWLRLLLILSAACAVLYEIIRQR